MLKIYKISSASPIDFAAEELKRYFRMMMPEAGDISVQYDPSARDGFRVGLLSDFGLDDTDVEDPYLDEILYADCTAEGGIIAGNNPRAVLLSVYEYLRAEGCRWLFPGVDGEYIPDRAFLASVSFRKKPSCRYRGFATATAAPLFEEGRALVRSHYNSDIRVRTVAVRLLSHYIDLLEKVAAIMAKKVVGRDAEAKTLLEALEEDFGKRECEIERYFNHCFFFNFLRAIVISNASKIDFVL